MNSNKTVFIKETAVTMQLILIASNMIKKLILTIFGSHLIKIIVSVIQ